MRLLVFATLFGLFLDAGDALQIQCYQCEEIMDNDCSTPEYIVNCNGQRADTCQKELFSLGVKVNTMSSGNHHTASEFVGIHYRKSCASSSACLIASSGDQQFCTGRLNSVCISCCSTPLCKRHQEEAPLSHSAAASNRRALLSSRTDASSSHVDVSTTHAAVHLNHWTFS
ncbi:LOW QUALITY PROTEIN: ly6/PLAUR domain-containing protein 1-like [Anableps anableps]